MNHLLRIFIGLLFLGSPTFVLAQDVPALTKEGVALQNAGKYPEAIEKYTEALKAEPDNGYVNYSMGFSLNASKKSNEAIPFLEQSVKTAGPNIKIAAYCLLGSIYDNANQAPKAIDAYKEGIKLDAAYPQIYYNLGLVYFRNNQYQEAEDCAINAIKQNPKNASSQRLYALVCFHQNKRANALLGLCSFILLEPNTSRSTEAYNNIKSLLRGGVVKNADGSVAQLSSAASDNEETTILNAALTKAALTAQAQKLQGNELLAAQLKNIFIAVNNVTEKKTDKNFFDKFYADYFYKLAQSGNVPALAKEITTRAEDSGLNTWIKITEKGF